MSLIKYPIQTCESDITVQMNVYTAKMVSQYPERFGFFAFLPMPDLNASIEEARYALDVLKADGVVLLGNARGRYFSEPEFHPLLAELNKRQTVSPLLQHMTLTGWTVSHIPQPVAPQLQKACLVLYIAFGHVSSRGWS